MNIIARYKAWRERRYWQKQHLHFIRTMVNTDWRWLGEFPIADALTARYQAALSDDWYTRNFESVEQLRERLRKLE